LNERSRVRALDFRYRRWRRGQPALESRPRSEGRPGGRGGGEAGGRAGGEAGEKKLKGRFSIRVRRCAPRREGWAVGWTGKIISWHGAGVLAERVSGRSLRARSAAERGWSGTHSVAVWRCPVARCLGGTSGEKEASRR
jgi:hypothetical protein